MNSVAKMHVTIHKAILADRLHPENPQMLKFLWRNQTVRNWLATTLASYLQLVWQKSARIMNPADLYELLDNQKPCIIASWHGQHFLLPLLCRPEDNVHVLISRSDDGSLYADIVAKLQLRLEPIRGSAGPPARMWRKGGPQAFRKMKDALQNRAVIAMTADAPGQPARHAGKGIVRLAMRSQCPIIPIAAISRCHVRIPFTWDRMTISLPWGRLAVVMGEPIWVPITRDKRVLEEKRLEVQVALNAAHSAAWDVARNKPVAPSP